MCSNMAETVAEKRINTHGMEKKDSAYKRSNKPYMEKKRRARINNCLTQLKTLVLQAMRKDTNQYSKLEKADILEMTVKHLRQLQRQHVTSAMSHDPNMAVKYRAGFNECANEVVRYLGSVGSVNTDVRTKLVGHLGDLVSQVNTGNDSQQTCHQQQLNVQIPHSATTQSSVSQQGLSGGVPSACLLMPAGVQTSPLVIQSQNSTVANGVYHSQQSAPAHSAAVSQQQAHSGQSQFCGSFQIIPNTSSSSGAVAVYLGQAAAQSQQQQQQQQQTSPILTNQAVPLYSTNHASTPLRTKASMKAFDPTAFNSAAHHHESPSSSPSSSFAHASSEGHRSASSSPSYSPSSQDSDMSMSSHHHHHQLDLSLHGLAVKCGRTPSPLKVEDVWRPW